MVATTLPRIAVAAPASGHGKTTVATGLMAALSARGLDVSGHKVGPDYIDPGYHAMATGRPGRNLDPFLVGDKRIVPLLLHGAAGADVAVIEGVMGLFDGRLGGAGEASTAHVARLTSSPIVLVIDISHASRTHAAVVAGLATFDPSLHIAGVILNKAASTRHADEVRDAMVRTGVPVLGVLPRDACVETPSRHLGLVPAAERAESAATLTRLATFIAEHVDVDLVVEIARRAKTLDGRRWDPAAEIAAPSAARPRVAMAGGRAFTFRYAEAEELLRAAGCDVVDFDPLNDKSLPVATSGLYLGGGFPEVHAAELAGNVKLINHLRAAITAGMPTVAECAGLTYLCASLDNMPMIGALGATAAMTKELTLGYRTAVAPADSLLARTGERITGHEFHRTRTTPAAGVTPAWDVSAGPDGFAGPTLHASYLHVQWAGYPLLAQRFANAVHRYAAASDGGRRTTCMPPDELTEPAEDPLRHHGDAETAPGLLDFAVNVYAGPRPDWLSTALRNALDDATAYPDARAARAAIAERHGRPPHEVLPTAGATEAFALVASLRSWRHAVVVHPQFSGPHAALVDAGHIVTTVSCRDDDGFALHPEAVPNDADLVVIGNPTNPTGVLHPAQTILRLLRPGRVVLVDEAFLDAVPGQPESVASQRAEGLLVTRSLTKHWSIPGVRAGYLLGDPTLVADAAKHQLPWSVSTLAIAAMIECTAERGHTEGERRAQQLVNWRTTFEEALTKRGIPFVSGHAPFVLARVGVGVHSALREQGIAVRRADTFIGLDPAWVRIAVRDDQTNQRLLTALDRVRAAQPGLPIAASMV